MSKNVFGKALIIAADRTKKMRCHQQNKTKTDLLKQEKTRNKKQNFMKSFSVALKCY